MGAQKQPPMITLTLPSQSLKQFEISLVRLLRFSGDAVAYESNLMQALVEKDIYRVMSVLETFQKQTPIIDEMPINEYLGNN